MSQKSIILPKIYKPSGGFNPKRWFVFFSVRDSYTGKMKRFRKQEGFAKCTNNKECQANANRLKNKFTARLNKGWSPFHDKNVIWDDSLAYQAIVDKRQHVRRSKKAIPYYLSLFLKSKKPSLAHGSYQKYQSELRIFKQWLIDRKLSELDITLFTKQHALEFLHHLEIKRKLSGKSMNFYIINLRNVWKYAAKEINLLPNIWQQTEYFKETTKPQRPLNRATIHIIKNYLEKHDPQLWLAAQFMYYCFIRPKELRFLQIKHLDLFEGRITLHADITKSGKMRIVDVDLNFLSELFEKYQLNDYPESYYIFSLKGSPGEKPVGKNYFWNHFNDARVALKLPRDYKFYGFKHTGAVVALKNGANIKEIQHQMGHSSVAITDEYLKNMVGYESEFFKKKMPEL